MTDLAERFARTQGWVFPEDGGWQPPPGEPFATFPTIDVNILPIIWADCKAKGWTWNIGDRNAWGNFQSCVWKTKAGAIVFERTGTSSTAPVAALCEAYCAAKEQEKAP